MRTTLCLVCVKYSTQRRLCDLLTNIHSAVSSGHDDCYVSFEPVFARLDHRAAGVAVALNDVR
jgi:hypothetical protein